MLRPKDIVDSLGISAPTLRLWSKHFAPVLSAGAQSSVTETGGSAQRRYTQEDLAYFTKAKGLLDTGLTYEQTLERLQSDPAPNVTDEVLSVSAQRPAPDSTDVAVPTDTHPIIAAFQEALRAKDETIQALQHSLSRKEGDIQLMQMATQDVVVTKDAVISAKDQVIEQLERRVDELVTVQAEPPIPSVATRFRWSLLNRLLTDQSDGIR